MDKFLSMLGMSRKASRSVLGYDHTLSAIFEKSAKAVFCAADLSDKTKRGIELAAREAVPVITVKQTMFEMSNAVGVKTGIVCITDSGFAKRLIELSRE